MEAKQRLISKRNVGRGERMVSLLLGTGMLAFSVTNFRPPKIIPALGSAYMFYRGISGKDPVYKMLKIRRGEANGHSGIEVVKSVTVYKSLGEVYRFWRNFENLALFMEHLQSVTIRSDNDRISHWVTKLPLGSKVEWDAEIVEDIPNQRIAWRSLPGSPVSTIGNVTFRENGSGQGTEITVSLTYHQPAGSAGAFLLKWFGEEPAQQIQDDLRRMKELLETGEVSSIYGQTSGRVKQVRVERKQLGILEGEREQSPQYAAGGAQ